MKYDFAPTKPSRFQPFEFLTHKGDYKWFAIKNYCLPKDFIIFDQKQKGLSPNKFKATRFTLIKGDLLHISQNVLGFLSKEHRRSISNWKQGTPWLPVSFQGHYNDPNVDYGSGLEELEKFEIFITGENDFASTNQENEELVCGYFVWKWVYSLAQTHFTPSRIKFPTHISVLEWAVSLGILECSR
jgi:hypothetical protein